MPLAQPGGWAGPAFSPIPGERQGFTLAPAFPPAVAGMWWPREQCRHLAPVPSVPVLGAAARAQPCSQGAGRKQMEMTPAAVSCGRTRWLSPPLLHLPSQRDLGSKGIAAWACRSPVPDAGTGTLLAHSPPAAPSPLRRVPGRSTERAMGCALPASSEPASGCPGAEPAGTRGTGPCGAVPRPGMLPGWWWESPGKDSAASGRLQPPRQSPAAPGREDGRAKPQLCITGCRGPAAATPGLRGTELREGRQAQREHPAQPRRTLHNGGLFGTNSFPINYVI